MPSGYMKVVMGSKKPKANFLGRYGMLQSWPDYSDPTVAKTGANGLPYRLTVIGYNGLGLNCYYFKYVALKLSSRIIQPGNTEHSVSSLYCSVNFQIK